MATARSKLWNRQEAVAAIEFAIVISFILGLLAPMADLVIAGNAYISAYQAIRAAGVYAEYHSPADITNMTADNWPTVITNLMTGTANTATVYCGNPGQACTSTSAPAPRYFVLTSTITPNPKPLILTSLSHPVTITYAARFQ